MSLITTMREKKEDAIVGYTDFIRVYSKKKKYFYCFFEAKDDEIYYSPIIGHTKPNHLFETFTCNNKDGVLKVYHLIKNNRTYKKAKTGFFIDRDFDKLKNNPEIYETPFYSIENFYVGVQSLKEILYQQFGIARGSADFILCTDLYRKLQSKFHDKVLNLNAWLACYADIRNTPGSGILRLNINTKINFIDKVVKDLSDVNIIPLSFNNISALFASPAGLITKKRYKKKKRKFASCKKAEVFRGKFEMQFFVSFLSRLKAAIEHPAQTLCSKRYKTSLQFTYANIYTQLNTYAFVPKPLRKYIRRIAA